MPKSKHRRNGQTRPRVPQRPQTGNADMAGVFQQMYEQKLKETMFLQSELAKANGIVAALVLEMTSAEAEGNPNIRSATIFAETIEELQLVVGLDTSEDDEGNPIVEVFLDYGVEQEDEDDEDS